MNERHRTARVLGWGALSLLAVAAVSACTTTADDAAVDTARITSEAPLERVRVESDDASGLAEALLREGYDVVEGSQRDGAFEVIGTHAEVRGLAGRSNAVVPLEVGGPLATRGEPRAVAYPPLAAMHDEMRALAAAHPGIAKVVDLTEMLDAPPTVEGRHLLALRISKDVETPRDVPTYLLVANHHARELGPPVVAMLAMRTLTSEYTTSERVRKIVDDNEIWIAPTWNPDGLERVHRGDNLWRKNRRPNGDGSYGVDLNRNYSSLWSNRCSGGTRPSLETYKGPSPNSEPETQTMVALSSRLRFGKVLDLHSSGQEVLVGYACSSYALGGYFRQMGAELSRRMGYGGRTRAPSAEGEHVDWQLGHLGSLSFLVEINRSFQPPLSVAEAEAAQIMPGILWHMERPIPLQGHVRDATTGEPIEASVAVREVTFTQGETNTSGGRFGRFQAFLPPGAYTIDVSAPGYAPQTHRVTVSEDGEERLEVGLQRARR